MVTLNQFVIFSTAAKHRNLTRTAEILRISQPSVTKQLKLLADELNTPLYERNGRGIELTEHGETVLLSVNSILGHLEDLQRPPVLGIGRSKSHTLVLAGSYGPSASVLPSLMGKFQKNHPGMRVSLRTGNRSTIERLILKGDVEIAVITTPTQSQSFAMEPYRQEKLAAFVSVQHPLAMKTTVSLADLFALPLIIRGENGRMREILKELEGQEYKPIIAACYESPDAVKMAVRKNTGVGFLYRDLIRPDVRRGDFKILKVRDLKLDSQSFIIYHKERPLSANASEFLALLRKQRKKD